MLLALNRIWTLLKLELEMIEHDVKDIFFDTWKGSLGLLGRIGEHTCNIWFGTIAEQSVQTYMEKRNYDKMGNVFLKQIDNITQTFITTPKNKLFLSEENEIELEGLKQYIKNFVENPSQSTVGLNYLFVGVPGTGKTYSMKIIWDFLKKNAMNKQYKCFFFPGSFFKKFSENDAIKAISALFENINKLVDEGKIVALFVDEIDALLAGGNNRSDLLNHFLSNISNLIEKADAKGKFITIGSSNHPQVIDEANARRFKMIRFESPSAEKKSEMFLYYLNKYAKQFNVTLNISKEFLNAIISLEDTFTGSDIENISKQTIALCVYGKNANRNVNTKEKKKSNVEKKTEIITTEQDVLKQCFNIIYTKYEITLKLPQSVRENFRKKSNEIVKSFEQEKNISLLKDQILELKRYMLMVTV